MKTPIIQQQQFKGQILPLCNSTSILASFKFLNIVKQNYIILVSGSLNTSYGELSLTNSSNIRSGHQVITKHLSINILLPNSVQTRHQRIECCLNLHALSNLNYYVRHPRDEGLKKMIILAEFSTNWWRSGYP